MNCDIIHNMMKMNQNRICADCNAKNPLIINLAFRTFICEKCANVQKYNKPEMIKGIIFAPTSSFSVKEIKRMQHVASGNEATNATYLASYNPFDKNVHPHPNKESSLPMRKSWIFHKYVQKKWYKNPMSNTTRSQNMNSYRNTSIGNKSWFNTENIASNGKKVLLDRQSKEVISQSQSHSSNKQNLENNKRSNNDMVIQLMRHPPNRKCVDCATKSPNFVNMSHGTFLCKQCAPFHEELSYKVVEVGRYDFTTKDIFRLNRTNAGNEFINASFLRLYDPLKHIDKPPTRGSSDNIRMAWITKKYGYETWYQSIKPRVQNEIGQVNAPWLQLTPSLASSSSSTDTSQTGLQSCFKKRNAVHMRVTFSDMHYATKKLSRIGNDDSKIKALNTLPSKRVENIATLNSQRQHPILKRNPPATRKSSPKLKNARTA